MMKALKAKKVKLMKILNLTQIVKKSHSKKRRSQLLKSPKRNSISAKRGH